MQFAEATKLNGLVITSSPGPHPRRRTPRCSAVVPEETATASSTPTAAAKSLSKRAAIGPRLRRPDPMTSAISSSSRSPTSGRASGIGPESVTACPRSGLICCGISLVPRLEGEFERVDERFPGCLDDVLGNTDRAPLAIAVGAVEQDAGDRAGPVRGVEDPDLEVGQLDLGKLRMVGRDRAAKRLVERVDRAVALAVRT